MNKQIDLLMESWNLWRDCLIGDDQNSIFNQIYLLNWNYAIFQIINESRRIQTEKKPDRPEINAPINYFIDRSFLSSHLASIRRLIDGSNSGLIGSKSIFSLKALINDMQIKKEELTRERYFTLRELQYSDSEIKEKRRAFFQLQAQKGENAFLVPKELDSESIEEAHELFDILSNTSRNKRKPDDKINNGKLDSLINKLTSCKSINIYVNKYIAHSATPESREIENADSLKITLNQIFEAQKNIFIVAELLAIFLFGEGHIALPLENPSLYDYLEIPLISNQDDLERIKNKFDEYREITEKWTEFIRWEFL